MSATSNTQIVMKATVDYYTDINILTFYALVLNKDTLAQSCNHFIDYGSTYAIDGIQKTFFDPSDGLF